MAGEVPRGTRGFRVLHLVVKNDTSTLRELPHPRPSDHLRLVVSRSVQETRIERIDLADRLAMEWRESFLAAADRVADSGAGVIQLFSKSARLQLLPIDSQLLMDEPLSPR